ncbi:hypothetical protein PR202_ga31644 [Eleusine coracana subsp. coracana]|uniref:Pentatricopeptide repeat-containing protein n=1 Tax=Eleusine coracana subsp. coracana TaxID=191504 RepID=A0AAV5DSW9_ELECO|nr:hypothetical protein PR202_ga31644 [Eleusine coracana subsp. coracana]
MLSSSRVRLSSIFAARPTATPPSKAQSSRAPHLVLAAAVERARCGTLGPKDAHHLLDELLEQATPVPERALNDFLAALVRVPPSASCSDGPALAISLFNRMSRGRGPQVAPPTACTYAILIDCCGRARRPDLALAFFGRLLSTGLGVDLVTFGNLLKCLCDARRTEEASDVLLRRMPEFACVPNVVMYSRLLKCFCDDRKSWRALELLRLMGRKGCSPDVVAYSTVINGLFKEGKVTKACDLFYEMIQQGISPNAATYNSVIDALCKTRAMDKAEVLLQQMIDKGVMPDNKTYNSLIHGYPLGANGRRQLGYSNK